MIRFSIIVTLCLEAIAAKLNTFSTFSICVATGKLIISDFRHIVQVLAETLTVVESKKRTVVQTQTSLTPTKSSDLHSKMNTIDAVALSFVCICVE